MSVAQLVGDHHRYRHLQHQATRGNAFRGLSLL
jgi:hypothetical protein